MELLTVLFWSIIGGVFSLIFGVALLGSERLRVKAIRYGLPFGAGALLAAAFLGLLPEAVEGSDIHSVALYVLGGFLTFFVLERLLGWFHHHHDSFKHAEAPSERDKSHQWLIIIGDTLHNAIDGVAIGAAFLVDPAAGIGTALAVAAHEIPQEIGDFSILLGKGMKARNVLLINLLSALATVVAAVGVFLLGDAAGFNPALLLAVAAGFFIYIAASDIIPDIHEKPRNEANVQALMLLIGVLFVGYVISLTPHNHGHDSDSHPEHNSVIHEHESHDDDHNHNHEHEHEHSEADHETHS